MLDGLIGTSAGKHRFDLRNIRDFPVSLIPFLAILGIDDERNSDIPSGNLT